MRSGCLFLLFLGLASSSPLASNKNVNLPSSLKEVLETAEVGSRVGLIEGIILEILEELRNLMLNGSDNFPVLDPIYIENVHIDGEVISMPNSFITIKDLWIRNITSFEMEEIQFSVDSLLFQRFRLAFNLVIPVINVNADNYDMFLNVFGGQVYGTGDMSLQIVNTRVRGHVVVGLRSDANGTYLLIHESRISFGMDSFDPTITGMFNNEASSIFVSNFLRNLVREMLDFFEEEITNILSTVVVLVGNIILGSFDLGSLFPLTTQA
ncbi:unnamed protein product [Euphydryas editha]|uniref:Uncharacterized protein n=1 Tax=Euphydryas editha TaxID=104508 RepID=A0AAU9UJL1_EUPED|nr:unnamed protein product [Euphydryas editha]